MTSPAPSRTRPISWPSATTARCAWSWRARATTGAPSASTRAIAGVSEPVPGFEPENELEQALARDPELLDGLAWGKPRKGHPEGAVGEHVADLLSTLESWSEPEPRRSELRFLALLHDSQKTRVQHWRPRTGDNHHAMRARRLAESYTGDERLLATIEHHDRPYAIWRRVKRTRRPQNSQLDEMLAEIPDPALFMRFVELDACCAGKKPEPVEWLREALGRRALL